MAAYNHTTSRRALFAGAGAAALTLAVADAASVASPHSIASTAQVAADAELIAACDTFIAADRRRCALGDIKDTLLPGRDKARVRAQIAAVQPSYHDGIDAISDMPASTPAGLRAKARAVSQAWNDEPPPDTELVWSIVRDLLRGVAGAAA